MEPASSKLAGIFLRLCYPARVASVQLLKGQLPGVPTVLPLLRPEPVHVPMIGETQPLLAYLIDVAAMSQQHQARIIEMLIDHYHDDAAAIRAEIMTGGLPIRADWCRLLTN